MAAARVRYKGLSDERIITQADLKSLDIDVPEDLVWNNSNRKVIELDLTDELESVLRNEGTFTISQVKDDGTDGDGTGTAADPAKADDASTASEMTDATTGQTAKGKSK